MPNFNLTRIKRAYDTAKQALLAERNEHSFWTGELSSSALATATATSALSLYDDKESLELVVNALNWLSHDQNEDGGWGDSPESPSNLSTTLLVIAAFTIAREENKFHTTLEKAYEYATKIAGAAPKSWTKTIKKIYGKDKTFAIPILSNLALAELTEWQDIPELPFELSCLPRRCFQFANLGVVSYALPALIAIGQLLHYKNPSKSFIIKKIRDLCKTTSLNKLRAIQPESGGYLEAIPLTAFVCMSLTAIGYRNHEVVQNGIKFLHNTVRKDGNWAIDTNISMWLTTNATTALAQCEKKIDYQTHHWIAGHQQKKIHPYTGSSPGGWAWTNLSGGVPDADDTAGALIALAHLREIPERQIADGIYWLIHLQNNDGGWPTFCRGWLDLPFDQSSPDITAHSIRALCRITGTGAFHDKHKFYSANCERLFHHAQLAMRNGFHYLKSNQANDGSWSPLWFGSQLTNDKRNPVFGTSRVLRAYADSGLRSMPEVNAGLNFILQAQNKDGGWGANKGIITSIEETALAIEALTNWTDNETAIIAWRRGSEYLADRIEEGMPLMSSPIGLYFASLWYSEKLYPLIWTTGALGRTLHAEHRL